MTPSSSTPPDLTRRLLIATSTASGRSAMRSNDASASSLLNSQSSARESGYCGGKRVDAGQTSGERLVHTDVVDLVVDAHQTVPQPGEVTEPARQHVVDDAVLVQDGEGVAEVTRGSSALGGDDVVRQIDAGLRCDLDEVPAGVHLVAQVLGDRQVTQPT